MIALVLDVLLYGGLWLLLGIVTWCLVGARWVRWHERDAMRVTRWTRESPDL